jgi:hypothetical protein
MSSPIRKAIEKELESDGRLFFQLSLAEALHCTLNELKSKVTDEEMSLWSAYYAIKKRQHDKMIDNAKKNAGRR